MLGYVYTGSTAYAALREMFSQVELTTADVIVDVGCGKGRLFNWLLHQRMSNQLIGIDVDPEVAAFTRKRLLSYPQVTILTGNFSEIGFPDGSSIFYLYNPFKENLMRQFVNELLVRVRSGCYKEAKRPLVIYHNCDFLFVFEENPVWVIQQLGVIGGHNTAVIWYDVHGEMLSRKGEVDVAAVSGCSTRVD